MPFGFHYQEFLAKFQQQKRNKKTNACLIAYPFMLCIILVIIQTVVNNELDKPKNRCGCTCIPSNSSGGGCQEVCGIQYSDLDQVGTCPIPSPPKWPALMQVPRPEYRTVSSDLTGNGGLPDESCKSTGSCPATVLFTGRNRSLAQSMLISNY